MILLSLALAVTQQSTTCRTIGNTTNCETTAADPAPNYDALSNAPAEAAEAVLEAARRGREERQRRADAYAEVGKLIAVGRCEDARRLAGFYGNRRLIKDTRRACVK